ncbi:hypothetical protein HK57_00014 [Aspergillus ustus]|uniref:IgE-binding protein n=1 Tax=Aspergillus ustus TaxID=40382 RepID=A0A0C1C3A3_ASPUT|nr:hypothetical protein HK57_00014 [Aspergillus ustus]
MHISLLSSALALTLAAPSLAQVGGWITPDAGQTGTITDPSRVYCIIADGRLEASRDCTVFTSNGEGGFSSANGWLYLNEESAELGFASEEPSFLWQGRPAAIGGSTELLSYFTATDEEPVYGPTWNHVPGTNHVGIWTGDVSSEAPVWLSFVPESS